MIEDKASTVEELRALFKGWEFKGEVEGGGVVSMLAVSYTHLTLPTIYSV